MIMLQIFVRHWAYLFSLNVKLDRGSNLFTKSFATRLREWYWHAINKSRQGNKAGAVVLPSEYFRSKIDGNLLVFIFFQELQNLLPWHPYACLLLSYLFRCTRSFFRCDFRFDLKLTVGGIRTTYTRTSGNQLHVYYLLY